MRLIFYDCKFDDCVSSFDLVVSDFFLVDKALGLYFDKRLL
jgi:hypothetical protein